MTGDHLKKAVWPSNIKHVLLCLVIGVLVVVGETENPSLRNENNSQSQETWSGQCTGMWL